MTKTFLSAVAAVFALAASFLATAPAYAYEQVGIASYYYSGHTTANGEAYKPDGISAAHKTLPFGTRVKVTHLASGRTIVVRINDRGPFIRGRIIDLSRGAAGVLGIRGSGVARVKIEVIGRDGKLTRIASNSKRKATVAAKRSTTKVASARKARAKVKVASARKATTAKVRVASAARPKAAAAPRASAPTAQALAFLPPSGFAQAIARK